MSSKPSKSVAPKSSAPKSSAPKASKSSKSAKPDMASYYPDIPEDEILDEYAEPETTTKAGKSISSKSMAGSIKPTMLNRDAGKEKSMPPSKSVSKSIKPEKPSTKSSIPHTMLSRDGGKESSKSVMPPTMLTRDTKSMKSSQTKKDDDEFEYKSILTSRRDVQMASKQSMRPSMAPKEAKEQDEWVGDKLAQMAPCPDAYGWRRWDDPEWGPPQDAYICKGGNHGATDKMVQEGLGAIFAMETKHARVWEERAGPYYVVPGGFLYKKEKRHEFGLRVPHNRRDKEKE